MFLYGAFGMIAMMRDSDHTRKADGTFSENSVKERLLGAHFSMNLNVYLQHLRVGNLLHERQQTPAKDRDLAIQCHSRDKTEKQRKVETGIRSRGQYFEERHCTGVVTLSNKIVELDWLLFTRVECRCSCLLRRIIDRFST